MKSISFNEQYGEWNSQIRALVLGMLSLFMIIIYSATFFISSSNWIAIENYSKEQQFGSSVLGISDKQTNVTISSKMIDEDIIVLDLNISNTISPLFANFVFYSPDVEIFDAYCINPIRCTVELEDDYLYIGLQGVVPSVFSNVELVNIEFNPDDNGNLILDNGLSSSSYVMEQGSDVNLIKDAYFSICVGDN